MEEPLPNRAAVLMVATLGGFLLNFTASAVNVALPLIEAEFHISAVKLSWISLSYGLAAAIVLMPVGWLADRYGRVKVFMLGMAVFALMSLASALAPSADSLLLLRALNGLGRAPVAVTAVALVVLAYPPESRGRALGLNVSGVYLGLTLGPLVGGFIVHNLGWRALFATIGLVGLANSALPAWMLRKVEWRETNKATLDVLGSIIFAAALTGILLGFSLLPSMVGVILIVSGWISLGLFVWWQTRAVEPLFDISLFRQNRVFTFSNAAHFVSFSATAAVVFLMSLYLQYNRGLDAQAAGLVLVACTAFQSAFSPIAGRLADRFQARYVASVGMALSAVGLFALSRLDTTTPYWYIVGMLCLLGLSFALFASPIMHVVMGSVGRESVGMASATLATARVTGQSMSMGIATLILALEVGNSSFQPMYYLDLLRSIRTTFLVLAVLCTVGIGTAIVGPKRQYDVVEV